VLAHEFYAPTLNFYTLGAESDIQRWRYGGTSRWVKATHTLAVALPFGVTATRYTWWFYKESGPLWAGLLMPAIVDTGEIALGVQLFVCHWARTAQDDWLFGRSANANSGFAASVQMFRIDNNNGVMV